MRALFVVFATLVLGVSISSASLASPDATPAMSQLAQTSRPVSPLLVKENSGKCRKRGKSCGPGSVCCGGLICQEVSADLGGGSQCQPASGGE